MRLAWYASIFAQCALVAALWYSGRRDWWLAYLVADLARSALLLELEPRGLAYFWVWAIGQALLLFPQFAAVQSRTRTGAWSHAWIGGAMAASAWVIALSPAAWPVSRQASLMAWHMGAVVCLAMIAGSAVTVDFWMCAYYLLQAVSSALSLVSPDRHWAMLVGTMHSFIVAGIFAGWAAATVAHRRTAQ